MNLVLLFLVTTFAGGLGGALGSMGGNLLGRGGVLAGGFVGGVGLVVAAIYLARKRRWIERTEFRWTMAGAVFGFALAVLVTLSTLSTPLGPIFSTILIGTGAVLGKLVGRSPHGPDDEI